jgi:hypothetical protein
MKVQMTGYEDRQGPWKTAIAGFPGTGKTLLASTAANPLFVFFQDNPRMKSIADRAVPHLKLANDFAEGGTTAQDKLNALIMHLQLSDMDAASAYQTLVIDTGDELFQSMKAARSFQTGGEFGAGDWNWIGDAYREVMLSLIDLPMDVIVIYHIKSAMDEEVGSYRELMLQGQAKDEAPGWFDIVGVLDTFEVVQEDGVAVTKRALLTHSSRTYPWLKDHSNALPRRFELSAGITDDYPRMMALVSAVPETAVAHEELEEIVVPEEQATQGNDPVPSPEELHAKKEEEQTLTQPPSEQESSPAAAAPIPSQDTVSSPKVDDGVAPRDGQDDAPGSQEQGEPVVQVTVPPTEPVEETVQQALPESEASDEEESIPSQDSAASEAITTEPDVSEPAVPAAPALEAAESQVEPEKSEPESQEQGESPDALDVAAALVAEELGGEEVTSQTCEVCGDQVEDSDLADLTQIRFRKYLCREHFKVALQEMRGSDEAKVG